MDGKRANQTLRFPREREAGTRRTAIYRKRKNKNKRVFWTLAARQTVAGSHFKEDEAGDLGGGASATLAHLDTLSPRMLRASTLPSRKVGTGGKKKAYGLQFKNRVGRNFYFF